MQTRRVFPSDVLLQQIKFDRYVFIFVKNIDDILLFFFLV